MTVGVASRPGTFLVNNGTNLVGIGNPGSIEVVSFNLATGGFLSTFAIYNIPPYLTIDRANGIRFHPQAWFDIPSARLITVIDEIDPQTLEPSRSIAFDVFDFTVPQLE